MKIRIDATDIGIGIWIACMGIGYVVNVIADGEARRICTERGGLYSKVGDGWLDERQCNMPKAKP